MKLMSRAEELILLMVWQLGESAYSVQIRKRLSEITKTFWSFGAVYMPLDRLVKQGLVESFLADPTPERGGRSKRIYQLTKPGLNALEAIRSIQEKAWSGVHKLSIR